MFFIVRHGQTNLNREKLLQGRSNLKLNDTGRKQAKRISAYFVKHGISFTRVYSSPLDRALETARIIVGKDAEIITDERLLEMDYGPYEGVHLEDPPKELTAFLEDLAHNPAPEGMEELSSVVGRLGSFMDSIAHENTGNVLITTHALAMKGALEYLAPNSHGDYWMKFIRNCGVYQTDFVDGRYTVPKELVIEE